MRLLKHLKRPTTILAGLTLVACCFATACIRHSPVPDGPNIVLVSFDAVRPDHLSTYGYERQTSENLSTIAADSVVFEMAIAQSPSTFSSNRALLTSRYPSVAKKSSARLAEVLKQAGYETAAWTGPGLMAAKSGVDRGFDLYSEGVDPAESPLRSKNLAAAFPKIEAWLTENHTTPFFIFLHGADTRSPYGAPPGEFERRFCKKYKGPLFGRAAGQFLLGIRQAEQSGETATAYEVTKRDRRQITALYDEGIAHADSLLGRLQEHLAALGVWDRTLLVVLSNHGEELWDHGSVLHSHTLYQELIRVPLVIRLPGGNHGGQRITDPVALIDVAPTILEIAGVPPAPTHLGQSLLPRIIGGHPGPVFTLASESRSLRALLRWPNKSIVDRNTGAIELYDLEKDPGELDDLAPGHESEALSLTRELALQVPRVGQIMLRQIDEAVARTTEASPGEMP